MIRERIEIERDLAEARRNVMMYRDDLSCYITKPLLPESRSHPADIAWHARDFWERRALALESELLDHPDLGA